MSEVKKPAWAAKLGSNDKTTFQAESGSFFRSSAVPGNPAILVKGKIKRADVAHSVLLQLPKATSDRLNKLLLGAAAPGIVGLIEYALDQIERDGITLTIENS